MIESVDIKDISGNIRFSTPINEGSKRKFLLMKEDYITLKFSLDEPVQFKLGDNVELLTDSTSLFEIVSLQKPTYNTLTGGCDYELQLDAYYWKWKNKIFKFTPEVAGHEASWNLTASLDVQLGVFLRNLNALGYTYRGKDFEFSIDSSVENKAQLMSYDNTNMIDALTQMAEAWECEWWVTNSIIHFGRCEFGTPVDFELGVNVEEMTRSDSQTAYATRIYAFGSTRNIPTNYRPIDESIVVNGVVQRRLMLPAGTPYIDAYPDMSNEEAIEDVVIFDDIYPRRIGTVSDITTKEYTDKIENEDGTTTEKKWNAYRFKDSGITFSKEYVIAGEELKIKFESGLLNGMEFAITFNPDNKSEKLEDGSWNPDAQVWEIVRNEDYGRPLPDEVLRPQTEHMEGTTSVPSDTYVLSGFDTSFVSDTMIPAAEKELKEKAEAYRDKVKIDPSTYANKMMSDCMVDGKGVPTLFEVGDRVNLINAAYFETGSRQSRIIGFEYNLDIPYDSPIYTVGETASYSRISEIEDKVDSLTYKGQTYTGGGSGVYVIGTNDRTSPSNRNVFSALKSLATFVNKEKDDNVAGIITFLKDIIVKGHIKGMTDLTIGESVIDSLIAGMGIIAKDGRIQADRMELRSSLVVLELIFNRLSAMESDYSFSESGTIESVEQMDDGTFLLPLRKRWDNDFTALKLKENDIIFGTVNNLSSGTGGFYTSWMRILHVDTSANVINAVLYPDSEVPGGKNYPPEPLMVITRRGNPVDEERQGYWYLSSREGCICMLDGVTKPILEETNYSVIVGKLKHLSLFDNLPVNYRHSYVYCRGIAIQDIFEIGYKGNVIRKENNRGKWSAEEAKSDPYQSTEKLYDAVYHYGCKWMCLITGTLEEPRYASTGWAMIEGNPDFTIDIESSNGWYFDAEKFATTLTITGELYNQDITSHILDEDIEWTRDTGNITEDNAWAVAHADSGKSLPLTIEDLGPDYMTMSGCKFIAKALLRDGQNNFETNNYVTF